MFNIRIETNKYKQLQIEKIQGLPIKPKQKNPSVQHISTQIDIDKQAENEGIAIQNRPVYRNPDFDIRLRKRKGENHKRKGHYSIGKNNSLYRSI